MHGMGWNYNEFHQEKAEAGLSPEEICDAWDEEILSQLAELEQQELSLDFSDESED